MSFYVRFLGTNANLIMGFFGARINRDLFILGAAFALFQPCFAVLFRFYFGTVFDYFVGISAAFPELINGRKRSAREWKFNAKNGLISPTCVLKGWNSGEFGG